MQNHSQNFSMQEAMRLAKSPAGQQLLALLQQKDSPALQAAMDQAATGNYAQAKDTLSALMASPEIKKLLAQMGDENG